MTLNRISLGMLVATTVALGGIQACSNGTPAGLNSTAPSALSGSSLDAKPGGISAVQLNLSHIECAIGGVEIHFVLLHVPAGATIGNLSWYNDGVLQPATVAPEKQTGNAHHFTVLVPPGTFDITAARVTVNGTTINLHNPGSYAGVYNCDQEVGCPGYQLPAEYTGGNICLTGLGVS
jgi:hypothetical protein